MTAFLSAGGDGPTSPRLTDSMEVLPMTSKRKPLDRFLSKIDPAPGPCWMWVGSRNAKGYGQFFDGKTVKAHRWAYQFFVGPIPKGLVIDHTCRVPSCVRPDHLRVLSNRTNILIGSGPPALNRRKTHCPQGHEYDERNTLITKDGRHCRACIRDRSAARRRRQRRLS